MYTLDIDKKNGRQRNIAKTGLICLILSIFTALFGAVYEHYSHEVYSYYMLYAFLIPLVGGALPYFLIALSRKNILPEKSAIYLYNSGLATLTVGSLLKGILDIYGTSNTLLAYYIYIGLILVFLGLVFYGVQIIRANEK